MSPLPQRHAEHDVEAYRPDIDGLRAIAVLSVVFFHLGLPLIHGGFVGVDIFFVISGYLIGGRMSRQLRAGDFSIFHFWERRIRRIFPAFAVMLLAVFAAACLTLLPQELKVFSSSAVSTALSISNVWFFDHSGYFDNASTTQPLLHTWSLAVEEQFYVFLPLFLVLLIRFARRREVAALVAVAAISFALSVFGVYRYPDATFYLLPTRIWELLLGTLVAIDAAPPLRTDRQRHAAGFLGLALIGASLLLIRDSTPFPGAAALPPCLGAALLIHAGRSNGGFAKRMLSWRPAVLIGLISYSLYLWHWPLIILVEQYWFAGLSHRFVVLPIFLAALLLAWLSWRFVERPFRRPARFGRNAIFAGFAVCTILLAGCGFGVVAAGGMPWRFSPAAIQAGSYLGYKSAAYTREGRCFITSRDRFEDYRQADCLRADPSRKNYLLVGDSYAAHYWIGLSKTYPGINFLQATASGCRPTIAQPPSALARCTALYRYIYGPFLQQRKIDGLVIAARWHPDDIARLGSLLTWARQQGLKTVLIGPMVQYDAPLPRLLAWAAQSGDQTLPSRHLLKPVKSVDKNLAAVAHAQNIPYYSLYDLLCPAGGSCRTYAGDGVPLQYDDGHVTMPGSLIVAQALRQAGALR